MNFDIYSALIYLTLSPEGEVPTPPPIEVETFTCRVHIDNTTPLDVVEVWKRIKENEATQNDVRHEPDDGNDADVDIGVHLDTNRHIRIFPEAGKPQPRSTTKEGKNKGATDVSVSTYIVDECRILAISHYKTEAARTHRDLDIVNGKLQQASSDLESVSIELEEASGKLQEASGKLEEASAKLQEATEEQQRTETTLSQVRSLTISGGLFTVAGFFTTTVGFGTHTRNVRRWTNPVSDSLPIAEEADRRKATERSIAITSVGIGLVGTGVGLLASGIGVMVNRQNQRGRDGSHTAAVEPGAGGFVIRF